jgi:hypothetical protein
MARPVFCILAEKGISADNRYKQENEAGDLQPELVQSAAEMPESSSGALEHGAVDSRMTGLPGCYPR